MEQLPELDTEKPEEISPELDCYSELYSPETPP